MTSAAATSRATAASAPELRLDDVTAGYYAHDVVLNGVSLAAIPNKVTAVLGPNGSGKSTALRVLAGFVNARSGAVLLDGRDITTTPTHDRLSMGIGFLPQGRSVFQRLTVEENLQVGAWHLRSRPTELRDAIAFAFERYPTLVPKRRARAGSLSGGQQRLLEIARLLVTQPTVLLIDEPSAGLSPLLADVAYAEIARLRAEGRTVLLVDQNVNAAIELADYVHVLAFGRNQSSGPAEEYSDLDRLVRSWLRAE
jgi:branched-chain amino acid transport system ATP-binding protein